MDPFDINVGSVSAFSLYAVSAARKYVALVEAQISKAHADERGAAFQEYRNIANRDETDYEASIGTVDRSFEEDYRPILRFTEVIYLYMVFESYTARHVAEIQDLRHERLDVLKVLKSTNKFGLVEAAQIYFRDHVRWTLLDDEAWAALREIAEVRNCIVHSGGVARDSKYPERIDSLESRRWRDEPVGIAIERYQGKDAGLPIIVHQRFLEYFLDLVDRFFNDLIEETHAEFWNKNGT